MLFVCVSQNGLNRKNSTVKQSTPNQPITEDRSTNYHTHRLLLFTLLTFCNSALVKLRLFGQDFFNSQYLDIYLLFLPWYRNRSGIYKPALDLSGLFIHTNYTGENTVMPQVLWMSVQYLQ